MKFTDIEARNGLVVIGLDDDGKRREIALPTIEVAELIGGLRASLEEAIGHPDAGSMALPGMVRVQIAETDQELFFRVYMSDRISHDYPVPKGTNLADELKLFAERIEARHLAKAINPPPDSPSGKLN